jgi:hypothetical protein
MGLIGDSVICSLACPDRFSVVEFYARREAGFSAIADDEV